MSNNGSIHTINFSGILGLSSGGTGEAGFIKGSVLFAGPAKIKEDNANFFWDNTNKRLGIGTKTPLTAVDVKGTLTARQVTTNSIVASGSNQSISLNPTGTGKVTASGVIESTSGGFKFPDGTTQLKANNYGGRHFQVDTNGTLNTSLVSFWKMDEPASAQRIDFWNGNHLTGNSNESSGGKINNSASFTRANVNYLSGGNNSAFDNPGDFSVSFWVKTSYTADDIAVISKFDTTTGIGWVVSVNGNGAGKLGSYISDGLHWISMRSSTTVTDGNWHHIVFIRQGNTGNGASNFYVDGGSAESVDASSSGTVGSIANNAFVNVGSHGLTSLFEGQFDELGFWNKALSSTERTDLWNSGNGQTMTN